MPFLDLVLFVSFLATAAAFAVRKKSKTRVRKGHGLDSIDTLTRFFAVVFFDGLLIVGLWTNDGNGRETEFLLKNEPNFIRADDAIELISLNGSD